MKVPFLLFSLITSLSFSAFALDNAMIEELTGLKGTFNEQEKVFKVTSPRGDLGVTVDEWKMPAFMGLTTWAAFADGKAADLAKQLQSALLMQAK